jgi:hypothetical protein
MRIALEVYSAERGVNRPQRQESRGRKKEPSAFLAGNHDDGLARQADIAKEVGTP